MSFQLKQKYGDWALITGATSGIGKQLATLIARDGVNVILVARREQALNELATKLTKQYDIETNIIVADLSTTDGVNKIKQVQHDVGLLALSAGLETNGAFEKNNLENERQLIQVNVTSTLELSHHFSNAMVKRGKGGILLVASLLGQMATPYFSSYAGSKAFVVNFGQSLFGELKPKGIDVSVLSPGLTDTPMAENTGVNWSKVPFSSKKPDEVARLALQGLGKRVVTVPGKRNKMAVFFANLTPRRFLSTTVESMLAKALAPERL